VQPLQAAPDCACSSDRGCPFSQGARTRHILPLCIPIHLQIRITSISRRSSACSRTNFLVSSVLRPLTLLRSIFETYSRLSERELYRFASYSLLMPYQGGPAHLGCSSNQFPRCHERAAPAVSSRVWRHKGPAQVTWIASQYFRGIEFRCVARPGKTDSCYQSYQSVNGADADKQLLYALQVFRLKAFKTILLLFPGSILSSLERSDQCLLTGACVNRRRISHSTQSIAGEDHQRLREQQHDPR